MPLSVSAQSIGQVAGLFNIVTGLMVVAGITVFVGGFIEYLAHLGTDIRDRGIRMMEWGVVILFVLILVLGVVHLVQNIFA